MVTKKTSKKVSKKVVKKTGLRRIKSGLPKKTHKGGIIKSKKTINNEFSIVLKSLSRLSIVFVVCAVLFVVILVGVIGSKL